MAHGSGHKETDGVTCTMTFASGSNAFVDVHGLSVRK